MGNTTISTGDRRISEPSTGAGWGCGQTPFLQRPRNRDSFLPFRKALKSAGYVAALTGWKEFGLNKKLWKYSFEHNMIYIYMICINILYIQICYVHHIIIRVSFIYNICRFCGPLLIWKSMHFWASQAHILEGLKSYNLQRFLLSYAIVAFEPRRGGLPTRPTSCVDVYIYTPRCKVSSYMLCIL